MQQIDSYQRSLNYSRSLRDYLVSRTDNLFTTDENMKGTTGHRMKLSAPGISPVNKHNYCKS